MSAVQDILGRFDAMMASAPYDPEAWGRSMPVLAELTGACSVQWAGWVSEHIPSVMMLNVDDAIFADWLAAGGATLGNPLIAASMGTRPMSTVSSHAVVCDSVRRKSDLWGYVHPKYDMPHVCAGKVWQEGQTLLTLNVMHTKRQGPLEGEALIAFERALVSANQAVSVARKVGEDGARLLAAGLDAVDVAAFVFDGFGRVIATSPAASEHLLGGGLRLSAGRLKARDARDDAALQAAIGAAVHRYPSHSKATREIMIRRPTPGPVSVLTITPLPEQSEFSAVGAAALGVARHSLAERLTAAERAILAMLVDGRSVAEIAEIRGSSKETVRSQIKVIYAKADVSSRGELLALYAKGLFVV